MRQGANVFGFVAALGGWPLLGVLWLGCRCSAEPSEPALPAPGSRAPDCVRGSAQLTLAPGDAEPTRHGPDPEPGLDLPFSTEPGVAIGAGASFFATALRHDKARAVAVLARVGVNDPAVEVLELGNVQGNVAPARVVADGRDLVVALQRAVVGGHALRLARLPGGDLSSPLQWTEPVSQGLDESNAFDLGARGGQALVVWDDWVTAANHGRVVAASITFEPVQRRVGEVRTLSGPGVDAEAPRVAARPGGYWLAWLVNSDARGAGRVYDPGGRDDDLAAPAASGARWLEVLPLDAEGRPEAEPRRLTPIAERVVGFDLTAGDAGNAWLAWRQDAASPAAAGGRILLAELRTDGTEAIVTVREDDVGAGEPTFLPGAGLAAAWLTFPDAQDRTLLLRLTAPLALSPPLRLGPELTQAAALAAVGERILFAQPRGRAIELFAAACAPASPSSSSPAPGAAVGPRSSAAVPMDAAAPE